MGKGAPFICQSCKTNQIKLEVSRNCFCWFQMRTYLSMQPNAEECWNESWRESNNVLTTIWRLLVPNIGHISKICQSQEALSHPVLLFWNWESSWDSCLVGWSSWTWWLSISSYFRAFVLPTIIFRNTMPAGVTALCPLGGCHWLCGCKSSVWTAITKRVFIMRVSDWSWWWARLWN